MVLKFFRRKRRESAARSVAPPLQLDIEVPEPRLTSASHSPAAPAARPSISVITEFSPSRSPHRVSAAPEGAQGSPVSLEPTTPSSAQDTSRASIFTPPRSPLTATPPTSVYLSPTPSYHPQQAFPGPAHAWTAPTSWAIDNVDENDISDSDSEHDTVLVEGDNVTDVDISGLSERCAIGRGKAAQLSVELGKLARVPNMRRLYLECQRSHDEITARLLQVMEAAEESGGKAKSEAAQPGKSLEQLREELQNAKRELLDATKTYEDLLQRSSSDNVCAEVPNAATVTSSGCSHALLGEHRISPEHPLLQPLEQELLPDMHSFAYTTDWKPIALTDLMDQACEQLWDASTALYGWLNIAESCRRHARSLAANEQATVAFVQYSKAATIVLQYIPAHPEYATALSVNQKRNLSQHGERLVTVLTMVGRAIFQRNEEWRHQCSLRTDFWPSVPKSDSSAFPWLLFSICSKDDITVDVHHAISTVLEPHVLREEMNHRAILQLQANLAQNLLDALQTWLDHREFHPYRRDAIYLLVRVATRSGKLPKPLFVSGVDIGESRDPWAYGGLADIFRATLDGKAVAVKRLRVNERGPVRAEIHRSLCKEALIWHQLRHPNVLSLLGIDATTFAQTDALCMVSPWMRRGTLMEYIATEDYHAPTDREGLLLDIAEGLAYLHSQKIVHGDLHGSNIFITEDRRACLADFGLTVVGDVTLGRITTTTHNNRGATRWLSPELLTDETGGQKTPASDVYGFGLLSLATSTKTLPWHPLKDPAVLLALMSGKHPVRPSAEQCHGHPMSSQLWALAERCWVHDPTARPSMHEVVCAMRRWPIPKRQGTLRPLPAQASMVLDAQFCRMNEAPVSPFLNGLNGARSGPPSSGSSWPWDRKDRDNLARLDGRQAPRPSPMFAARPVSPQYTSSPSASSQRPSEPRHSQETVDVERIADLVAQRLSVAQTSPAVDVDRMIQLLAQRIQGQTAGRAAEEPPPGYEG